MPGPQTRLGSLGRAQLQKYQKALPIQEGLRKNWLVSVKLANGKEHWRCKVCSGHHRRDWPQTYGQNGVAPNTARLSNFLRHAMTAQHVAATQAYLSGLPAHAGGAPISSKPCGSASPGNGVGEEKGFDQVVSLRSGRKSWQLVCCHCRCPSPSSPPPVSLTCVAQSHSMMLIR